MMKKILVIDDSKTVRTLCEWMYKGLEDKILTAESATSANGIIQNESPDVIFVDYTLPDADAYEFIATHAALGRAVVLLGGSYAPCDADKAKSQGAVDVLVKPFKTADFFDSVERASTTPVRAAAPA
ncbi:MAG: response regulator, partial [Proteobacteria bacterium]|nr:response regulator [Pseudomonadota bacterium]